MPALFIRMSTRPNRVMTAFNGLLDLKLVGNVARNHHGIAAVGIDGVHDFRRGGNAGVVVQRNFGSCLGQPAGDGRLQCRGTSR